MKYVNSEDLKNVSDDFNVDALLQAYAIKNLVHDNDYNALRDKLYKTLDEVKIKMGWKTLDNIEAAIAEISTYEARFFFNVGKSFPKVVQTLFAEPKENNKAWELYREYLGTVGLEHEFNGFLSDKDDELGTSYFKQFGISERSIAEEAQKQ